MVLAVFPWLSSFVSSFVNLVDVILAEYDTVFLFQNALLFLILFSLFLSLISCSIVLLEISSGSFKILLEFSLEVSYTRNFPLQPHVAVLLLKLSLNTSTCFRYEGSAINLGKVSLCLLYPCDVD